MPQEYSLGGRHSKNSEIRALANPGYLYDLELLCPWCLSNWISQSHLQAFSMCNLNLMDFAREIKTLKGFLACP